MANRIEKIPEYLCSNAGLPAGFTSALTFNEQVQWLLNAYNKLLAMVPDNIEFNGVKFIPQALTENEKNIAQFEWSHVFSVEKYRGGSGNPCGGFLSVV